MSDVLQVTWVNPPSAAVAGVDSNFAVSGGTLSFATIPAGEVLANSGSSTAEPTATSLSALLDEAIGATQGDLIFRGSSAWNALGPGTAGQLLQSGGAGANPSWITVTQYISSVDSNFAVSGNQLKLASIANGDLIGNSSGSAAEPSATTLTALIDQSIGATQGDLIFRGSSSWSALGPGTAGQVLQSGGAGANPSWVTQYIASVDSNFTVSGNQLKLASIASGDVIGNSGSGAAEAAATTITALLDRVFGSTEGNILQRGPSTWQVLAPGTAGQVLSSGGSSALNSWASLPAVPQRTVYISGSGTWTPPTGCTWFEYCMVGGGGGGAGSGTGAGAGGAGGTTTFGSTSATGGSGGSGSNSGGGGSGSGGDLNIRGGFPASGLPPNSVGPAQFPIGGDSAMFGAGTQASGPTYGAGGYGGANSSSIASGGAGGGGGGIVKIVTSPAASYSYSVGAGGTAGTAGTGGGAGGAGASGFIMITVHFGG